MGTVTWPEVGERVREARLAAGMSQADLGNRVGLERDRVSKIESGERGVNALELFALADALEVHAEHFVTRPPAAMVSRRLDLDSPDAAA